MKNLQAAINHTKTAAGDYWTSVLNQRLENSSNRAGSFFVGFNSGKELEAAILEAHWEVHEGSLESGKVILHTHSFKGKDGVKKLNQVNEKDIFFVNPKNIVGRDEYAIYVDNDSSLPDTEDTWLIISTYNPQTESVNVEKPFILTIFPGLLLGPNDTVKDIGDWVKLVVKP